jgi:hypothetical protein
METPPPDHNFREAEMDPVQEQLEAYNARDLDRFVACYAPEVVIEDAEGKRLIEGIEPMRAAYGALFASNPGLRAEVPTRIRAGEFVIDEERVSGLSHPGAPAELHTAVVYRVRDGRIIHVRLLK